MYLSCLLVNLGDNPDRPRPGRLWLRNLYRVHQRLCMAFPSDSRKVHDADFLTPYDPDDFASGDVHVARNCDTGFLFRIDPHSDNRSVILVQSAREPDWQYAFHNAGYLLAAPPQKKNYDPGFQPKQVLRFRLQANPTKRLRRESRNIQGQPVHESLVGKRVSVNVRDMDKWLQRRADQESSGFRLKQVHSLQPGFVYVNKKHGLGEGQRLRSVRYEGLLEVTDPDKFRTTLASGIGPAKAFGFGLLSVAPVR